MQKTNTQTPPSHFQSETLSLLVLSSTDQIVCLPPC